MLKATRHSNLAGILSLSLILTLPAFAHPLSCFTQRLSQAILASGIKAIRSTLLNKTLLEFDHDEQGSIVLERFLGARDRESPTLADVWKGYEGDRLSKDDRTVGLELEGVYPARQGRLRAAEATRDRLKQLYPDVKVTIKKVWVKLEPGYVVSYNLNGQLYEYKFVADPSIIPYHKRPLAAFNKTPVEIVSPILRTPEDKATYYSILEVMLERGFYQIPGKTGLHVHVGVGMQEPTRTTYVSQTIAETFAKVELDLINELKIDKNRLENFVVPLREVPGILRRAYLQTLQERRILVGLKSLRNQAVNFQSLEKYGTVEFRIANGTSSIPEIKAIVDFFQSMTHAIESKQQAFADWFLSEDPGNNSLKSLAQALNVEMPRGALDLESRFQSLSQKEYEQLRKNGLFRELWRNDKFRVRTLVVLLIVLYLLEIMDGVR